MKIEELQVRNIEKANILEKMQELTNHYYNYPNGLFGEVVYQRKEQIKNKTSEVIYSLEDEHESNLFRNELQQLIEEEITNETCSLYLMEGRVPKTPAVYIKYMYADPLYVAFFRFLNEQITGRKLNKEQLEVSVKEEKERLFISVFRRFLEENGSKVKKIIGERLTDVEIPQVSAHFLFLEVKENLKQEWIYEWKIKELHALTQILDYMIDAKDKEIAFAKLYFFEINKIKEKFKETYAIKRFEKL